MIKMSLNVSGDDRCHMNSKCLRKCHSEHKDSADAPCHKGECLGGNKNVVKIHSMMPIPAEYLEDMRPVIEMVRWSQEHPDE